MCTRFISIPVQLVPIRGLHHSTKTALIPRTARQYDAAALINLTQGQRAAGWGDMGDGPREPNKSAIANNPKNSVSLVIGNAETPSFPTTLGAIVRQVSYVRAEPGAADAEKADEITLPTP